MLKIKNLKASIQDQTILNGIDLSLKSGEIHVLLGPNGSGKSTLSKAIMGHPDVKVLSGEVILNNQNLLELPVDERAKYGLFVAYQYPVEVPGVSFIDFLRLAYNSNKSEKEKLPIFKFRKLIKEKLELLQMSDDFLKRNLNEGFSGGEKKKAEILQLAVLNPKVAILDETDSGLDVDALRQVFSAVNKIREDNKELTLLVITHYERVFKYITPNFVHLMRGGEIVQSGGMEIVEKVQSEGFVNLGDNGSKMPARLGRGTLNQPLKVQEGGFINE